MRQELDCIKGKFSYIPCPIWANRHMSIHIFTLRNAGHFTKSGNRYSI